MNVPIFVAVMTMAVMTIPSSSVPHLVLHDPISIAMPSDVPWIIDCYSLLAVATNNAADWNAFAGENPTELQSTDEQYLHWNHDNECYLNWNVVLLCIAIAC